MSTPPEPPEKKEPSKNGCLDPLVFWIGVPVLLFISKLVEDQAPGYGKWIVLIPIAALFIGIILYFIVDKTIKDTALNAVFIIKWLVILIIVSFVFSWCTDGKFSRDQPDIYYRK
jgi:high-affinity Fe2+/Pb2+ permease